MAETNGPRGPLLLDRSPRHHSESIDRDRLIEAHHAAARFFTDRLASAVGASPRDYLAGRGFGPLLDSSRWSLGYAPPAWTALSDHLRSSGYEVKELLAAGLATRTRHGNVIDRLRDRVTLPVHNLAGETVGFVGRAAPKVGDNIPKYLNSPRTTLYDKGSLLFGLAEQRESLAAGAVPVLVEGPFDVLAVYLTNAHGGPPMAAVAPCGTALTSEQVGSLAELTGNRVLVAFDPDVAGVRAVAASYDLLARQFSQLRVAALPDGCDAAELLQSGDGSLREALSRDDPLADRVVDHGLRPWAAHLEDNAEARAAALVELAPRVARLRPGDISRQAARLADRLCLEPSTVTAELTDAVTAQPFRTSRPTGCGATALSTDPFRRLAPAPGMSLH